MKRTYAVLIEKGKRSYGAFAPDLPGCVAVARTLKEVQRLIREAVEFHIEGMMLHGEEIPEATTQCDSVEINLTKIEKAMQRESRAASR